MGLRWPGISVRLQGSSMGSCELYGAIDAVPRPGQRRSTPGLLNASAGADAGWECKIEPRLSVFLPVFLFAGFFQMVEKLIGIQKPLR